MLTNAPLHPALHDGGSPISGRQSLSAEDFIHKAKVDLRLALLDPGRYKESSCSEGQAEKRKYGGEDIVFAADSVKRRRHEERDLPPSLVGKDDQLYPWLAHQPAESELSPSLRRTRALYAGWRRDIAGSLNVVLDCSERPEFYPSGWEKLLRGDYIDLEEVYHEFMYDYGPNDRATGKITTLNNWHRAFSPLSSAMIFLMPHRAKELQDYNLRISSFFRRVPEECHDLVIKYEATIRKLVSMHGNLLLTDTIEFIAVHYAIMHEINDRLAEKSPSLQEDVQSDQEDVDKDDDESRVLCRNFNTGRCWRSKNSGKECPYRHCCSHCGRRGHGEKYCRQKP